MTKADYVLRQPQTRPHECHWPGCGRTVPPAMWGCREHWFPLPKPIRDAIWRAYRPGQEEDGGVSAAYVEAAKAAREWIEEQTKGKP
jgi:hypothetical protein